MKPGQTEVLAPAGSFESMKAAIAAGADAVYIGGSRFGARAYADNPDEERLLEAIDYAHLHGASLYMTVNTLVKEREIWGLFDYLNPYYVQGLDGVIVQDLGVLSYIRQAFPGLPIHASTQMTITGAYGAKMLKDMGVKRVVAARELSLEEIRRIHEQADIELECFVHGALCYCYSGQCLFSSLIGGRSGNRGRCAQPCRLPYEVVKNGRPCLSKEQQSVMSLKDLCVLDILPELLEAGVDSLKIEGRMKSPRYTAGVASIYRKYVDLYKKRGRAGYRVEPEDKKALLDLFDRGGFTQGYYKQHNGRDMIALKEKPAFRQGNQELFDYLDKTYVNAELKQEITGILMVEEGKAASLVLERKRGEETCTIQVEGPVAEPALSQPVTEDGLKRQMEKTGNTPFRFQRLEVELPEECFLPVQAVKELRRKGLRELENRLLAPYRREGGIRPEDGAGHEGRNHESQSHEGQNYKGQSHENRNHGGSRPGGEGDGGRGAGLEDGGLKIHVLISQPYQLPCVLRQREVSEIQIEMDGFSPEGWRQAVEACHRAGKACVLALPFIFRQEAEGYLETWFGEWAEAGFDGILVRSLDEAGYLKKKGVPVPLYGDYNLYCFNKRAAGVFKGLGLRRLALPLELNHRELEDLGCQGFELVSYGYLPVMVTAQCVQKTVESCTGKPGVLYMKDRTGKERMVKNHCSFCYNTIYNPSPLSLLGQEKLVKALRPAALRLQFTREPEELIEAVAGSYADSFLHGKEAGFRKGDFTRGHFKRGVE